MRRTPRHKFGAKPTMVDSIRFASRAEARRYAALKIAQDAGEVIFFLRQTPFHLPGGAKYVSDYLVFWKSGEVTIEDVKGVRTPVYELKRKLVEHHYPVTITEIEAKDA